MPQYRKCACQAICSPATSLKFNVPFFIILTLIQCTDSCQTCIHRQYVFGHFYLFFCLPNLEDCEPAVWRHLISCLCLLLCWATKDYIHYKLLVVFEEMCYWTALHAGHVWFFFFSLCAWRCPFCRMTPAWHSYFIYELLTFLGQQQKSDNTPHPL